MAGQTALESGPISSVCHWQTGWLVPLPLSNTAISKQKHPRTLSPLSPDPSLLEFFPPLHPCFLSHYTQHTANPRKLLPANRRQAEKLPPISAHPHNTHTNRGVRERVMRKQNESNRERRWAERIKARGRGRAWSPWRLSNRKRTRH